MSYSVRLGCREPASEQRKEVVNQKRAGLCVSSKLALPWEPPLKDLSLCSTGAFQQALLGCQAEVSRKNRQTTNFQFNFFLQICLMNLFFFIYCDGKTKTLKVSVHTDKHCPAACSVAFNLPVGIHLLENEMDLVGERGTVLVVWKQTFPYLEPQLRI